MKTIIIILKLLIFSLLFSNSILNASTINGDKPSYDKVYRTDRIGDSYHFLMLTKDGKYHYLYTNRTAKLTGAELKSTNLLDILKKKQSWGQAFPKKGKYTIDNGKFYTKLLWDRIYILSPKKIKYLNKIFYLK
ncbi:MAG: hypothetical protein DSZ07_00265 [Sulfurovum sp.]|nr:MAG: hypothetical protein DSZ07_00265 [Sulfurovum sp.]